MVFLIALFLALVQQQPGSNGSLEGTVVQDNSNLPIGGVRIRVNAASTVLETITDAQGHFLLHDIPAGSVSVSVAADGYMFGLRLTATSAPVESHTLLNLNGHLFPARNLGFTISLHSNETLHLPVIPGMFEATIRGRVTDSEGRGLSNVAVAFTAELTDATGGGRLQVDAASVKTDDNGEFRRALSPGNYYVKATVERPDTASLTVYHPSTTDGRNASPVVLAERAEVTADIQVPPYADADSFKISGRVLDPTGKPPIESAKILLKERMSLTVIPQPGTEAATAEKTGRYELRGILEGSYDLFAFANIGKKQYFAKIPIEVGGRDLEDIDLVLRPPADVQGRLVIEGEQAGLQLVRDGVGTVRIGLTPKDGLAGAVQIPDIDDNGMTFTFHDVRAGEYNFSAVFIADGEHPANPDLYIADIRAGGRSVFDNGFDVGFDKTDALQVMVGTQGGSISGSVLSANVSQPLSVLLAVEYSRRSNASLVRIVPVNASGQYEIRGLTPATYSILAFPTGTTLSRSMFETRAITVVVQKAIPVRGLQVPLLTQ